MTAPLLTRWPVHDASEMYAVSEVLRSGHTNYWVGEHGRAFEEEWRRFVGIDHTLAVSNGTTALECALRGLGLGDADPGHDVPMQPQVIVPCRTFMATASSVVHAGGKPVLADIDADSLCVTPETLEERRTGCTVGVIVVHYAGLPVPRMDEIVSWAMKHGLWIIEDCAHAHGAGGGVGKMSHVACWSFCVGKIMSTGGEGGMVACLDPGVAGRMRAYRDHGRYQMTGKVIEGGTVGTKYQYLCEEFGSNLRMTEMQAVIGRHQLLKLGRWVERRREIAARYDEALLARGVAPLHTHAQRADHARYMYLVKTDGREGVVEELVARGVPARAGGTPSLVHEPAFVKRGWVWPTPVADRVGEMAFSLPVYPTMTDEDVERVCAAVREAV